MNFPKILTQLMLATLFAHELDAVTQSEWRLLYVLRSLEDAQGRWWFVAIHVPLFWALIALTHHAKASVERASRLGLAVFCIVHVLLHWRFASDPLSTFTTPLSWSLIVGPAFLGIAYLAFASQEKRVMTI